MIIVLQTLGVLHLGVVHVLRLVHTGGPPLKRRWKMAVEIDHLQKVRRYKWTRPASGRA